jgi:tryptophan synthase alpha chain
MAQSILQDRILKARGEKEILLMTHLVLGYPSFAENQKAIDEMSKAGVDLIELQIPFSEPMADGPVIMKANHISLKNGTTLAQCFDFAGKVSTQYPDISFLFMTYFNILFTNGLANFIQKSAKLGIKGIIIPDLPPEEGREYMALCHEHKLDPIFIFTPTSKKERLAELARVASGFVYCVGRKGVTGPKTSFDQETVELIQKFRKATPLPLALGFGIQARADIEFLKGKVDIAVIGTHLLKIHEQEGSAGIGRFLKEIFI